MEINAISVPKKLIHTSVNIGSSLKFTGRPCSRAKLIDNPMYKFLIKIFSYVHTFKDFLSTDDRLLFEVTHLYLLLQIYRYNFIAKFSRSF